MSDVWLLRIKKNCVILISLELPLNLTLLTQWKGLIPMTFTLQRGILSEQYYHIHGR